MHMGHKEMWSILPFSRRNFVLKLVSQCATLSVIYSKFGKQLQFLKVPLLKQVHFINSLLMINKEYSNVL